MTVAMRASRNQAIALVTSEGGFALILVLWALMVLTVITASFAFAAREERLLGQSAYYRAQAQEVARAGINHVILHLLHPDDEQPIAADGAEIQLPFGDNRALVRVQSESGKIQLNSAPLPLLEGIARVVGASDPEAAAAAIADWRDANDTPLPRGAEADAYRTAKRAVMPANSPFTSLRDLSLVMAIDPSTAAKLARFVTIHGRSRKIDLGIAPAAVLLALPGATPDKVAAFVAGRDADGQMISLTREFLSGTEAHGMYAVAPSRKRLQAGVYTIESMGRTDTNFEQTMRVVVQISASRKQPYRILEWQQHQGFDGDDLSTLAEIPPQQ
jgi:general secretion pathway protein K